MRLSNYQLAGLAVLLFCMFTANSGAEPVLPDLGFKAFVQTPDGRRLAKLQKYGWVAEGTVISIDTPEAKLKVKIVTVRIDGVDPQIIETILKQAAPTPLPVEEAPKRKRPGLRDPFWPVGYWPVE